MVAAACGSDDDKGDDASGDTSNAKTYSIAYVGPKTGDAANLGINILNGAKLAVNQFNDSHDDIQIDLKEFDTQGDPAQAPSQLAKYKDDTSILGLVGPAFSGETKAVLPDLQNAGLVMISSSATNADLPNIVPNETVFHRALPDDAAQGAGIAKFLKAKYAGKSVFYIHDNQEYSKGLAEQIAGAVGGNNKGTAVINKADDLYTSAVNAAKAAKPDVIVYGGYYAEAGKLKKQLTDAGVTATFISGDGSLDPGFIDAAGAQAEGAIISCPCNLATETATGKLGQFAKDYKAEFNQDAGTYSSEAFDAANILMNGIVAGNTTRAKLLAYVEGLPSYDGISKKIEFETNGNLKATTVYFFEVKNGKFASLANSDTL
jgi:branched-chain amino acid transport system substrate-binding protein